MGVNMYLLCTNEICRHVPLYLLYVHMINRKSTFRHPRILSRGSMIVSKARRVKEILPAVNRNHIQHAADDARLSFYSYVCMDGWMNVKHHQADPRISDADQ